MAKKSSSKNCWMAIRASLRRNLLILLMLLSMVLGIGLGMIVRQTWSPLEKRKIAYLKFPGDMLLSMLQLIALPLIVSSIISSLASLPTATSGSIGLRTLLYYVVSTLCAVITGIAGVAIIHPGMKRDDNIDSTIQKIDPLDSFLDMIRNAIPSNIVEAYLFKKQTVVESKTVVSPYNQGTAMNYSVENGGPQESNSSVSIQVPVLVSVSGANVLGLIVFSIVLGCVLSSMEVKGKPLADLFQCLYQAMMKIVMILIWFTPVGLMFLIAAAVVQTERPMDLLQELAVYIPSVIFCMFLHTFGTLPLMYFLVTRRNPYTYLLNMSKAILTAFGTSSSAATLPVTMECLIHKNQVDSRVVNFITPIGATINMDGTALYVSMLTIFISQRLGITMDPGSYFTVGLTAVGTSIGAAGVPNGLVVMSLAVLAAGLPLEQLLLIAPIDWVFERFRTMVNITGDAFGAGIVNHLCLAVLSGEERRQMDINEAEEEQLV